jgi:hypothetical protein
MTAATAPSAGVSSSAFRKAAIVGTILQLAMVISGHWIEYIKINLFAVVGVIISGIAGAMYARAANQSRGTSALNGALVGGLCALIGIAVSYALGDVPAMILVIGTLSSAVGGAIGGAFAGGTR